MAQYKTGIPKEIQSPVSFAADSKSWRAEANLRKVRELPSGLDACYDAMGGFFLRRIPKKLMLMRRAKAVLKLDSLFCDLSDEELALQINKYKEIFMTGRETYQSLNQAFALVREVCWRVKKMKPYQVQVAGGLAIELGCIAEMSTGEGKTLTATMPGVIAGWRGKGCHIMTTNSYLAQRDAEEMGPVYEYCGLTVGHLEDTMQPQERKAAYLADITYCTNKDVAADFLRDQMSLGHGNNGTSELLKKISGISSSKAAETVLRGLECAIVDEADSVLIDDGVTPLLISGENPDKEEQSKIYMQAYEMTKLFHEKQHYNVDMRYKEILLTSQGEKLLLSQSKQLGGIWRGEVRSLELLVQALTVKHFFIRDKQYIIDDEKVVIVDEATGRLMPDRFWRSGIHQAVEAKEQVEINADKDTFARISFQKFFRLYKKLSGMTGTGKEAVREFWYYYHLSVVPIPTNRKCLRKQGVDRVFISENAKWKAVIREIKKVYEKKRPILIGTASIKDSHIISELLKREGIDHLVLNAIHHAKEAEIVAEAGALGKVTVATNMAGRGTDIKIPDNAKNAGGLHVIATERFESFRIDRQLYGRSSRQGDPGSAVAIVSLDDQLIKQYGGLFRLFLKFSMVFFSIRGRILFPGIRFILWNSQRKSVKSGRKMRKGVMKSDNWLEQTLGFTGKGEG